MLLLVANPALASIELGAYFGDCASVSMTVTAAVSSDPGFEGLWKYTLSGSWDVGQHALSHLDILLMIENCPILCDAGIFHFASPSGQSTGEDSLGSPCTLFYGGSFLCNGDPSIPPNLREPTVKFQAIPGQSCETTTEGSGTWFFYSLLSPGPETLHQDVIVIKHGNSACTGDVTGRLPICETTAIEENTWGSVKILFR
jgi:hypothetical protein